MKTFSIIILLFVSSLCLSFNAYGDDNPRNIKENDNETKKRTEKLIQKFGGIDNKDENGDTPLIYAINKENEQVVLLLIKKGADINITDRLGQTTLHLAVNCSLADTVSLLLKKGMDVNIKDEYGQTPLHCVLRKRIAEILLSKGANINEKNKNGETPLIAVSRFCGIDLIEFLISKGADFKISDSAGFNLLHLVIMKRNSAKLIRFLVAHGVDLNAKNFLGQTPLFLAAGRDNKFCIEFFIENGADISATDKNGWTPLHFAAYADNAGVINLLIKKGAKVDAKTGDVGWTALHMTKDKKTAEILIENGADVNALDQNGQTPLHWAVFHKAIPLIQLLLDNGAIIDIKDNNNQTPADITKDPDIKKLLIEYKNKLS